MVAVASLGNTLGSGCILFFGVAGPYVKNYLWDDDFLVINLTGYVWGLMIK
jgi:hypothetical protein